MPTSVRQDILLYKARGFSPRETQAAMQQDAGKDHGFGAAQGDQGVSLRSIQRVYEKMDKHGIAVTKSAAQARTYFQWTGGRCHPQVGRETNNGLFP